MYPPIYAELTIFAIALIALAITTAALRLLPSHWQFRKLPVCERTWPALAISLLVLALWFSSRLCRIESLERSTTLNGQFFRFCTSKSAACNFTKPA